MIDPIHNQAYQEYTKVSSQKNRSVSGEKFSMDLSAGSSMNPSSDHTADGVIYEPGSHEDEKSGKAGDAAPQQTLKPGSRSGESTSSPLFSKSAKVLPKTETSFLDSARRLFQHMLASVKKVLSSIWESNPSDSAKNAVSGRSLNDESVTGDDTAAENITDINANGDGIILETHAVSSNDAVLDQDIKRALKSGDTDTFRALLSDDGRRIPAKNTSLLTYYDASGRLVKLDPSKQYRILHGDRGSRKS